MKIIIMPLVILIGLLCGFNSGIYSTIDPAGTTIHVQFIKFTGMPIGSPNSIYNQAASSIAFVLIPVAFAVKYPSLLLSMIGLTAIFTGRMSVGSKS